MTAYMNAYKVTVTDTAAVLIPADNINRRVWVQVVDNETIWIGGPTVTTANGFPLFKHTAPLEGGLPPGVPLYAIADAAKSVDVRVITPPVD